MEKSLALREELTVYYAEYLKREDLYLTYHTEAIARSAEAPRIALKEQSALLEDAKRTLEKNEQDEKSAALVALEKRVAEVRTRRQAAVRGEGLIEGQIAFLERRIQEMEQKQEEAEDAPVPYSEVKTAVVSAEKIAVKAADDEEVSAVRRALTDVVGVFKSLLNDPKKREVVSAKAEREELAELTKEREKNAKERERIAEEEVSVEEEYMALRQAIEDESTESREAERAIFEIMNRIREAEQELRTIETKQATLERERTEFKRELQEGVALIGRGITAYRDHSLTNDDGMELTLEVLVGEERAKQYERRRHLEKMKIRLEELGVGANEDVLKEYTDVKERDEFLVREITDLEQSAEKLEVLIVELTEQLNEQFVAGIEQIQTEFARFFTLMFGGGSAKLDRVKPKVRKRKHDEDFDFGANEESGLAEDAEAEEEGVEGIEINVQLPNKRVRGLDMLSGGERALTSIALIFAMSQVNPPLFVILDETDAALDEANSRRYGDMISALAERSQLILITHNRETMSRAGVLYGVTMAGDGVSKLLSVKFDEAVAVAK